MGFQVSPGVEVKEIDLTNVIPAVSTSIGGYSGYFRWGPVNEIGLVSSEKELGSKFGSPDAAHTQSFLTAASFLKYGNALKVVRAGGSALKNASAGTFEVLNGGIEGVAILTKPTQFVGVEGDETLSIIEKVTTAGSGASIAPRYDVATVNASNIGGSAGETTGYKLAVDAVVNLGGASVSEATYSVTIQGKTVTIAVDSSGNAKVTSEVFFPSNAASDISDFVDGSTTITSAQIDSATFTEVEITLATSGVSAGSTITIFTDNDTTNTDRHSFTVTVSEEAASPSLNPVFTLATGVTNFEQDFTTLTASMKSGLEGVDEQGNVIPGLYFDATYDIDAIAIVAEGGSYNTSNVVIGINEDPAASPVVITELAEANFNIDELETDFNDESDTVRIDNEDAFEALVPSTGSDLPGLLFARYPGTLGNSLGAFVIDVGTFANTSTDITRQFDAAPEGTEVHVYIFDRLGEITGIAGTELEKYSFLDTTPGAKLDDGSNNYYKDVINEKSDWMYVGRDTAASETVYDFGGGADVATPGTAVTTDITTALAELDDPELVDVNLLFAQADVSNDLPIGAELQAIAFARKDAVAFVSTPVATTTGFTTAATDVTDVYSGSSVARGVEGSYAMLDSTALYVYNKYADNYVYIPAAGHMAGLCAKTDGIAEPWFSPAGFNRGSLLGVAKLGYNPKKADRDTLYKAGVNPIVSFPGQGIVLFGDKTAQSKPSAFDRINVRRLFTVLEKAIATAAKFQLFELNDEFTRAMFRNMTEPFLRDVKGRRGITDFLVVCDETNNTGEVIDTNRFVADIYIKPARSINFITLNFIATRTGVDFSEIVGK